MRRLAPSPSPLRLARVALALVLLSGATLAGPAAAQAPTATHAPASAAAWDAALARFADELAREVEEDAVGGIAAGVAVDGDLVWARGFGWADRDARVPMGGAAISRTGSISKSVTAVLLARLVDRGVLSLDDPVARYFPEIEGLADARPGAPAVTFRHLATHTAGIIREPRLEGAATGPIEGWEEKVLASIPLTAFDTIPGARYSYSNIGYGMLGLALSRAAGRPFMELVEEELFRPLGMTGSTFVVGAELAPRLAAGYRNGSDGSIDADGPAREHAGRGYKVPNGGVYSTVADLARFAGAVSGVPGLRILSEATREEVLRVQTPENPDRGYGLGFSVSVGEDGARVASHGGSVAGYTAHLAFDPDARIAVVLLRNYQSGATNLGRAAQGLVRELAGAARTAAAPDGLVRTADPYARGYTDDDFPRVKELAEGVYSYEQLRSAGDERFTTVSLIVETSDGVLVADGQGNVDETRRLIDTIGELTPRPITHLVIASDHGDHTGGNSAFPAGIEVIAHRTSARALQAQAENPGRSADAPPLLLPTRVVDREETVLRMGEREIRLLFLGRAHTGGDLLVHLPEERILFMSEAYLARVFPAMRSAYPSEWVRVIERAQALDVDIYVPGHGFVDPPEVLAEELDAFRRALVAVIEEGTRLHAAGVDVETAVERADFGEFDNWSLRAGQGPIAIRQVYRELNGELPGR